MTKKLSLAVPKANKFPTNEAKELLDKYEAAELEIARLTAKNQGLFDTLQALTSEQEVAREALKRLCYTKNGPPPGVSKVFRPALGEIFELEVAYKQRSDYYEPSLLPKDVLLRPGVIVEVDKVAVESLNDTRCEAALVAGDWLTPSVSIKRRK